MPDLTDPRAALRAAADHQARVGLHQRGYFAAEDPDDSDVTDPRLPCCPLGALHVVTGIDTDIGVVADAARLVEQHISERDGTEECDLASWVDQPGRTLDEVVTAMRHAAEPTDAPAAVTT